VALFLLVGTLSTARAQTSCGTCDDLSGAAAQADGLSGTDLEQARHLWRAARHAWHSKDWDGAEQFSGQLVSQFPGTGWEARGRSLRGLLRKFRGDWDEAVLEFEQVISAANAPQRLRHDIMTSLGCVLLNRGRFDDALRLVGQVESETTDWDQKKFCRSWIREIRRRQALQQQTRLNSCGARSLAYVMDKRKITVTEEQLAAAFAPYEHDVQVSLETLRNAARALDMAAEGVKIAADELVGVNLPVIGLMKPGHYVVITAADAAGVTVYDPDRGLARYTREVFNRSWAGYALLFGAGKRQGVTLAELTAVRGGTCSCCPTGGLGGEQPGSEYDPPPKCPNSPGMPSYKINMVNLNWVVEDIDLRYRPAKGPEILFRRTFNNGSSSEGAFGRGWTHSYAMRVEEFPGQVQVVRGDGRVDTYIELGGGAYDAPLGVNDALTKNPDGSYSLDNHQEKLLCRFDPDGTLTGIEDRNGNAVTMSYADNRPTTFGSIGTGTGPRLLQRAPWRRDGLFRKHLRRRYRQQPNPEIRRHRHTPVRLGLHRDHAGEVQLACRHRGGLPRQCLCRRGAHQPRAEVRLLGESTRRLGELRHGQRAVRLSEGHHRR
jgi:predicted double-glycine peptidase